MSTIDPRLAQDEKAPRERSRTKPPWGPIGLIVLHLALWALAGFGIASQLDVFRLMSDNQVGAWSSNYEGNIWMLFVGAFLGAILSFILTSGLRSVLPGGASFFAPTASAFFGVAIGTALFYQSWTRPQEVGFEKGFLDSGRTAWDAGGWIFYYLPYWLPALLLLIGLVVLVFVIRLARSKGGDLQRTRTIIRTGVRVAGTVTEADSASVTVSDAPMVTMTVKYRDANGIDRWVTKRRAFTSTTVPRVGDTYTVFYDAQDPGNQTKIVVFPGTVTPAQAAAASWS
jgi:hypothetical protein